ncbi:filamentous hemeagglutinin family domain protein [Dialister invisus DSM 15470]|uniref:Filamentous hemeagglutinin family domain protein n=2 Tax=Dialister invisus TaxID=218538 RepID=C9LQ71_9FIRM|nr:hemagglutinin repeat-containing protein [Dialister invisus]EEW97707.1 filamentous hemeagglutinin family domain protein [Dialister invisus DSM 15470]
MKTSTSKRLRWNVAIWLAAGLFMTSTAGMAAGPIMPDPKAEARHQPQIEETANGIPLVNITAPSSGGVSRNEYETFNVPDKGAILNNSYTLSKTELAGYVQGNNNMAERPAKIIVNEVTGAGSTAMDGFLEVAGNRADVVIANPNGITVNGGGFINTGKAFLTTGKPVYDGEDHLQRFDITGGDILIEGKGLGGKETGSLAILSRAVKINAGIWAKDLHITTGANTVDAKTLEASAIEGKGGRPAFALDTAAIGGMYAGRITLVGTEKGLGVNNSGTWSAEDNLTLDWNGDLKNSGTIYSKGNTDLRASCLENDKTIAAGKDVTISADGHVTNTGTVGAGINEAGGLTETGTLEIQSGRVDNRQGTLLAGNHLGISSGSLSNEKGQISGYGTFHASAEEINNTDGKISFIGDISVKAKDIANDRGRFTTESSLFLRGNTVTNEKGTVIAGGDASLYGTSFNNTEGNIITGKDMELVLPWIRNRGGTLSAKGSMKMTAEKELDNETGRLLSDGDMDISASVLSNKNGTASSGKNIIIKGTRLDNAGGTLSAQDGITLHADRSVNNAKGKIQSSGDISLSAAVLDNREGKIVSGQNLAVKTKEDLLLQGKAAGGNNVTFVTAGNLQNRTDVTAGNVLHLSGKTVANAKDTSLSGKHISIEAGQVENRGLVQASDTVSIEAGTLDNIGTGKIYGDTIRLSAAALHNHVDADKEKALEKAQEQAETAKRDMEKALEDLAAAQGVNTQGNSPETEAAESVYLAKKETFMALQKAASDIYEEIHGMPAGTAAARKELDIRADRIDNRIGAMLYSGSTLSIRGKSREKTETVDNWGGTVASRGDMSIRADHLANRNANLAFGMEESGWEQAEPDRVRFSAGGQTYNVLRSRLAPWEIGQEGSRTGPGALDIHYIVHPELYGKEQELPLVKSGKGFGRRRHYTTWDSPDWQLPGVKTLGITPPSAPPPEGTPAYDAWQAEYDAKLRELEEKIPAYNARVHEANRRIEFEDYYLYVSKKKTITPILLSTAPGTIQSGGDLLLDTDALNKDSAMQAGGTLKAAAGNLSNISTAVKSETLRWNTVTFSEVVRVAMGTKHSRHSHPQDEYEAPALSDAHLPTVIAKDHASPAISAVTAPSMKDLTVKDDAGYTQTLTGQISRNIPNTSIYKINKETTATYLIETDPAFTDRKKFLSSDYMYEQMKWDPDKTIKRLGDGFYEQELVRQQIMELRGTRYLPGYTGDEEEYKALMESGAAFARKYDLKPGIALTKEQMAALTGDIVWLVREKAILPGGKTEDVLVPRVYLKAGSRKELRPDGSLISASRIVMDLKQDLENSGTMQGKDGISIKAGTINGHGNFTGGHIALDTQKDMALHGILAAEKSVKLASGGNIDITSETYRTADKNGSYRTGMAKTAGIAVKDKEGLLILSAKNDLSLSSAELEQLGEKGASLLSAGRDVRIGAVHTDNYAQGITDSDNYLKDRTVKDEGTVLVGKGNVQIGAGRDITAKAAYAESKDGSIRMSAGRDIALTAGEESSRHELGLKYKESGGLSTSQTTMKEDTAIEKPEGSLISGKEVQMAAGRNIALRASAAAGENDVSLTAGNDITADSADEKTRNMDYRQVKKSGLIGSGLGFTIGSEKKKDSYDTEETVQVGSTVGSVKGSVAIHAQNNITVRASDIIAGKDTLITGRNVDIESHDNTCRGKEEHEYKKSGLTVSLGGAVITAKDNIIRPIKNAGQAHDGLLGKLYAADAGFNLHDAVKIYKNIGDVKKGITLDVSIGSRSAKSDSRYQGTEAKKSRIVSKGNVRIKSDENIAVKGSQITGENVTLQAGKDINLTAAENRKTAEGNSRSKGAGITASFGIGGLQNVGISAGKSKGNREEEIITHTGSAVTAKNTLTMESGKDLNITGSKAGGKKVEVKTGNNLSIESLQDSHTYHSRDKESGIHLQRDRITRPDTGKKKMDDPYFSIGKKTETTDSAYESVTKQAGIYAGKEGYDIQVKNNTRLKGAVIDSQAPAEKNKLTTGTLTWENIDNKAEYKTGGHGISYNGKIGRGDKNDPLDSRTNNRYGKDTITGQRNGMNKITQTIYGSKIPLNERGLLNTPIPSVKGKAGTTTRSAVSKGTITITDKENQKQDIEKLNRNTEDSLNKLKEIFDKTKVEERKRLLEELGIVGNQAIHEIASHNGWKDGSAEKAALHGMLGAITGAKSGGSALSGLIAGGANEYAIGYLKKTKGKDWINKHPDTVQNISAAFGGILSKMTGGSGHTGAYISQMGTKWNLEGNDFIEKLGENASASLTQEEKEAVIEFISKGMTKEAISYLAQRAIMDYPGVVKEYAGAFEGVRFLGRLNTAYGIASAIVWYYKKRYENRPDVIGYNEWIYNETGMDINYLK